MLKKLKMIKETNNLTFLASNYYNKNNNKSNMCFNQEGIDVSIEEDDYLYGYPYNQEQMQRNSLMLSTDPKTNENSLIALKDATSNIEKNINSLYCKDYLLHANEGSIFDSMRFFNKYNNGSE